MKLQVMMDVEEPTTTQAGQELVRPPSISTKRKALNKNMKTKTKTKTKKRKAVEKKKVEGREGQEKNDESEPETASATSAASQSSSCHVSNDVAPARALPEIEGGESSKDTDAVEALLSLHHPHSDWADVATTRRPAHKKLKRSSSSISSSSAAPSTTSSFPLRDLADTDSETDTTSHPVSSPAAAHEVDLPVEAAEPAKDDEAVVMIAANDELRPSEDVKEEPQLPRAVRITSRAHLVLHQLYLRKRFGSPATSSTSLSSSSSSPSTSSTIAATSVPLHSMAASPSALPLTSAASLPRRGRLQPPAPSSSAHTPRSPTSSPSSTSTSTSTASSSPAPTIPAAAAQVSASSSLFSSSSPSITSPRTSSTTAPWPALGGAIPCLTLPPSVPVPWSLLASPSPSPLGATAAGLTPIRPRPLLLQPTPVGRATTCL